VKVKLYNSGYEIKVSYAQLEVSIERLSNCFSACRDYKSDQYHGNRGCVYRSDRSVIDALILRL